MPGTGVEATRREPRWPAALALLAVGGLNAALPESLSPGPRWLLLLVVAPLLAGASVAHHRGWDQLNRLLGHLATALVTLAMGASLFLLVRALPSHAEDSVHLLRSAAMLWVTNVLVFASWYWRLDAGGPHRRARRAAHLSGAFLFPQMSMGRELRASGGHEGWSPGFVDYLFLAFNTSTALSPTDTAVVSPWAKLAMMVQSLISLAVVALLAARAVNMF
jgi:hypothetical protein